MILVDNKNTSDPYINLAIEEFLVRQKDCTDKTYVLLYINEPSIVLGKNQCIYKEVNFEYLRNGKLKLCRRISGGGTVYHDSGNLNFAFITRFSEEKINNYKLFNRPLAEALRKAGAEVQMDERNNMIYDDNKFSGSAQFTNRNNILSHGTILFNAELNTLRNCLNENEFTVETRAVNSVRSKVKNIGEVLRQFSSAADLRAYLISQLSIKETYQFSTADWESIHSLADSKFRSYEWVYGRSPGAKIVRGDVELLVVDGKIKTLKTQSTIDIDLIGVPYTYSEIKKALENYSGASEILKMIF